MAGSTYLQPVDARQLLAWRPGDKWDPKQRLSHERQTTTGLCPAQTPPATVCCFTHAPNPDSGLLGLCRMSSIRVCVPPGSHAPTPRTLWRRTRPRTHPSSHLRPSENGVAPYEDDDSNSVAKRISLRIISTMEMQREETIGPLRLPALLPVELAGSAPKTICVTGATGFAGAHIVMRALLAGHTVRGTVRAHHGAVYWYVGCGMDARGGSPPRLLSQPPPLHANQIDWRVCTHGQWAMRGRPRVIYNASPIATVHLRAP